MSSLDRRYRDRSGHAINSASFLEPLVATDYRLDPPNPRGSSIASLPAISPCTTERANPCWLNPPADSPPQYNPGMTRPTRSTTWHLALMRRPARESCGVGVAHAAWNGGSAILCAGAGLPKSASTP